MKLREQAGFSLIEMSIVLIIVGALAGSLVTPMRDSIMQAKRRSATQQLIVLREALHGYLIAHGRLPCPVSLDTNNISREMQKSESTDCEVFHGGYPAVELGVLGERSAHGLLVDPWGNPIYYSLSDTDHALYGKSGLADWTNARELVDIGAGRLVADIELCSENSVGNCPNKHLIASDIVWVVYSTGTHASPSAAEKENLDNDRQFTLQPFSINNERTFDDHIIWASRSELIYWLLKANHLP
jgi:prepilin-type N-terminal cleavage/methylation domain-containing protein